MIENKTKLDSVTRVGVKLIHRESTKKYWNRFQSMLYYNYKNKKTGFLRKGALWLKLKIIN
jgi:hypothetical protein